MANNLKDIAKSGVTPVRNLQAMPVEQLLRGGTYEPLRLYQRSYEWEDKHVTTLLSDIERCYRAGGAHDVNEINVVVDSNGSNIIIDGCQRITTVMLTISAFRDFFAVKGKDGKVRDPEMVAILNRVLYIGPEKTCRLMLKDGNDGVFGILVAGQMPPVSAVDTVSKSKLCNAKSISRKWVDDLYTKDGLPGVHACADTVLRTTFGTIINTSLADAAEKFGSMNTKGKPLSMEVQIRKMILDRLSSDESMQKAHDLWNRTFDNLTVLKSVDGRYAVEYMLSPDAFLAYYLMSRGIAGITKKRVLPWFEQFAVTHDGDDAGLLAEMSRIESASQTFTKMKTGKDGSNVKMRGLSGMYSQSSPVLMAVKSIPGITGEDYARISRLIENLYVIKQVIDVHNQYKKPFEEICAVCNSDAQYTEKIVGVEAILCRIINDKHDSFVSNLGIAKYGKKNEQIIKIAASMLDANTYGDGWTVDAINPKKGSKNAYAIGNLVLVPTDKKLQMRGKSYTDKKELYANSGCRLTTIAAEFDKFSDKEMSKRTKAITSLLESAIFGTGGFADGRVVSKN